METANREKFVAITRKQDEQQIAYGAVYGPGQMDSHGEFMLAEDVEKLAHRFLRQMRNEASIDIMHDGKPVQAFPVESYIARDGDPDFPVGTWVLGVKVEDPALWKKIKEGKYNGFSFAAMVKVAEVDVDVEVQRDHVGRTEKNTSGEGHTHAFFLQVDKKGRITKGKTDTVNGHSHSIVGGSATDESDGHSHRIFV